MINAIETVYKDYRFRSRLEARWAVFFDTLGIKYEYEHEGFNLNENGYYLPDFWLPIFECYVEIKPFLTGEIKKSRDLLKNFSSEIGPILLLIDTPQSEREEQGIINCLDTTETGTGGIYNNLMSFKYCERCEKPIIFVHEDGRLYEDRRSLCNADWKSWDSWGLNCFQKHQYYLSNEKRNLAIAKARQARFEHGEKP